MLHDLAGTDLGSLGGGSPRAHRAGAMGTVPRRDRPRLLIVHHSDRRLAALQVVLGDLGYETAVAASAEEAASLLSRGPSVDVLLTTGSAGSARRGVGFARDCLARSPSLRVLYITFVPRPLPELPGEREALLIAPFNAEQLAGALAELWSGAMVTG
jgi:CheY-like chemotaxis protein